MAMTNKKANLIPPYGGKLVNLVVEGDERQALIEKASHSAFHQNFTTEPVRP